MDLRLPVVDGLEATRQIRQAISRGEGRATRIVVLSASALEHERAEALACGADTFISTPFGESSDSLDRSADALVTVADSALYRAKSAGRDRVEREALA